MNLVFQISAVVTQPKKVQKKKFLESSGNEWSSALFDFCDNGKLCFLAFFCPPCFTCWLFSKAGVIIQLLKFFLINMYKYFL